MTGMAAALLFPLLFTVLPAGKRFVAEHARGGGTVLILPFRPGDEFSISYIHSVNRSGIIDRFSLDDDGTVRLEGSIFSSYGAGVAGEPEGSGVFSSRDGYLEHSGIDMRIPDLVVFVGTEAEHRFHSPAGDFRLADRAPPGSSLRFGVRKVRAAELVIYSIRKGAFHE